MREQEQKIREQSQLIDSISASAYYDAEILFDGEIDELKKYLKERSLETFEWDQYVIMLDKKALKEEVNLCCEKCTRKNEFGCCCGSPCNMSKCNLKNYRKYQKEINKRFYEIDPVRYAELLEDQKTDGGVLNLVDEEGFIGEHNGRCNLLVRKDGMARCITHLFAIEQGISPYELSPLSCLMFPVELFSLLTREGKNILLVTSAVDNEFSTKYGRWGGYRNHHLEFQCVDKKSHDEAFTKSDYHPLYKVSEKLITHEFGVSLYKKIEEICSKS